MAAPAILPTVITKTTVFPITERVTLSSLGHLIENLLEWTKDEGIDLTELFPADFFDFDGFGELGLDYLDIQKPTGEPLRITATFSWPDLELSLIPNLLAVGNPQFTLNTLGSSVSVVAEGVLTIEDYALDVRLHLPSFYLEAELPDTGESEGHSALGLLKRFNAHPGGSTAITAPRLSQLLILAHPRLERAVFKLALDNLDFGPVSLDTQLELIYQSGSFTGFIWGDFLIEIGTGQSILLTLSADYDGPAAGWQLEGGMATSSINLVQVFEALLKKFGLSGVALPGVLANADIELRYLHLSFNTHTRAFDFACSLSAQHLFGLDSLAEGSELELNLNLQLAPYQKNANGQTTTAYDLTFGGQVVMRLGGSETDVPPKSPVELAFDLVFDKQGDSKTLVAAYHNLAGGQVHLKDLVGLFSGGTIDLGDLDFAIDLKQAYFISSKQNNQSKLLIGLEIGAGLDLSKLPLVGQMAPNAKQLTLNFQPFYANAEFKDDELGHLQAIAPSGVTLPTKSVPRGLNLTILLNLAGTPLHLDVPLSKGDLKPMKSGAATGTTAGGAGALTAQPKTDAQAGGQVGKTGGGPSVAGGRGATAGEDDGTKWIDINKAFGPVHFQRLGFQYADKNFWFRIDGALVAAGLTLSLQGLSVGVTVPDFTPSFELQGLGLAFKKGAFEIGGAFLRIKHPTYEEYAGLAYLRFQKLELSAIGSYAKLDGYSSLMLYAVLKYPLGGPSFFFVTGLAAGFGYNRDLVLPPVEEVSSFPLVAMATDSTPADAANLTAILTRLGAAIPPLNGQYFLAAGIKFTSFKLIDSFLLLSVSFGVHTEIGLLGLSTLQVPMAEVTDAGVPPLAKAQLAIRGSFVPEEGFVGIQAMLTKESFLLSRDCRLTGGFAFYAWFGNSEHAGDFVLSLGGYHPHFNVPAHYPTVPRLGVDWHVGSYLSVKAEMYFALTASSLMAGGNLRADYHHGGINAWFDLGANFIISWKPYYYDAEFHVNIGADVSISEFGLTIRKTLDVSADVHVFGPEFSGVAHIDLMVSTFTITFGSQNTVVPYISWDEFQRAFLPDAEKVIAATVTSGKVREIGEHIVINSKEFELTVETSVPVGESNIRYGGNKLQAGQTIALGGQSRTLSRVAMRPLEHGHPEQVRSSINLTLTDKEKAINDNFAFEPVLKKMPVSLWDAPLAVSNSKPGKPDLNGPQFIHDALAGFIIRPANPPKLVHTHQVARKSLQYTSHEVQDGFFYEPEHDFVPQSDLATPARDYINAHILDQPVKSAREQMLTALGFQLDTFGLDIDTTIADTLVEQPIVGQFARSVLPLYKQNLC